MAGQKHASDGGGFRYYVLICGQKNDIERTDNKGGWFLIDDSGTYVFFLEVFTIMF